MPLTGWWAGIDPRVEATFVPDDPPRRSRVALWTSPVAAPALFDAAPEPGAPGSRPVTLELAVIDPVRRTLEIRPVDAYALPLGNCLDSLGSLPATLPTSASVRALAHVVRTALAWCARGRLRPTVSPQGWDSWTLPPGSPDEVDLLVALADSIPPGLNALADPATATVTAPHRLVSAILDAVADTLVRTPAAAATTRSHLFAAPEATRAPQLREWTDRLAGNDGRCTNLELRVHAPQSPTDPWRVGFGLRSRTDPSVLCDAAEVWHPTGEGAPPASFGTDPEAELLVGVRRAARDWPAISAALRTAEPRGLELDDEALGTLVDATEHLEAGGTRVLWPAALSRGRIRTRLTVAPPGRDAAGVLSLQSLLEVNWEAVLDGEPLTVAELESLARAVRPIVEIRGQWVRTDPGLLRRLRTQPPRVRLGDLLAAAADPGDELAETAPVGPVDADEGLLGGTEFVIDPVIDEFLHRITTVDHTTEAEPPDGLDATLRPYQLRGLGWLSRLTELGAGGCLADDMGLGKTIQLIALHLQRRHRFGPTLVVAPTSLLGNWEREVHRFAAGVPVRRYHGPGRHLRDLADDAVVVTTYGVIRRDSDALSGVRWGLVVADEAQLIKNPRSAAARAIRSIDAHARLALTGTPVENRLLDLWALLDWTTPGLLGPMDRFRRELAVPIERDRDTVTGTRLTRLVQPFLLRRRKTDPEIAPDLPPKTERDLVVPLTPEQAALYQAVVDRSLETIAGTEGIARRGLVLKLLTALKQITNHPAQYLGETGPLPGRSGKLAALDTLVDEAMDGEESMLVFSQYVTMADLLVGHLAEAGVPVGHVVGRLSATRRQEEVDRFQQGETSVLVCSLKAAGVGLNLTAATQVVHYDRWWNPAVEDQATDRAYRIGQTRPVVVHRLVTEGTVEDHIATLLEHKRGLADLVLGSGESWISELDDAALAELVRLDPESRW